MSDLPPSAEASRGETPRDDSRTRPTLIGAIGPGWLRALVVLACVGLALLIAGVLWQVAALLAPVLVLFLAGWLLSCVLEPLVHGLGQPGRLQPWAAVGFTYAGLAVVLVLGGVLLAPALARQADATVARLGAAVSGVEQGTADIELTADTWLAERSLPFRLDISSRLTPDVLLGAVQQGVQTASPGAFKALTDTAGLLGNLGLTVLLSVFYAAGGEQLASQFEGAFSGRARTDIHFTLTIVHDTFARYLRCQVIQGLAFGAGTWVCLSLAHVDGAGLAATAAGVLLLIPLVGTVLALVPPLLGLLTWNPEATLPVLVALIVLQQLVLNGLGPRIMGRELGLPPLLVLGGVLVGATVSGFWGAILGVPALSVILKLGPHFRQTEATTDASSGN